MGRWCRTSGWMGYGRLSAAGPGPSCCTSCRCALTLHHISQKPFQFQRWSSFVTAWQPCVRPMLTALLDHYVCAACVQEPWAPNIGQLRATGSLTNVSRRPSRSEGSGAGQILHGTTSRGHRPALCTLGGQFVECPTGVVLGAATGCGWR